MKKLLIGLLALSSFSVLASDVFSGVGYQWISAYSMHDNTINLNGESYSIALKTAMDKCELKYTDCKVIDRDQKKWYAGVSGYTYVVTSVAVYGSLKKTDVVLD